MWRCEITHLRPLFNTVVRQCWPDGDHITFVIVAVVVQNVIPELLADGGVMQVNVALAFVIAYTDSVR